jgi:hypothetical protein
VQLPVPLHAPPHPANVEPSNGVAVNVTTVPLVKLAEHPLPQSIPVGLLVTVPPPVPLSVTVNVKLLAVNCGCSVTGPLTVNVHVPVPSHVSSVHPVKVDPADAVAVSVICVPLAKLALHVSGQLIPAGLLVTVPAPVPTSCTVTVNCVVAVVATAMQFIVPLPISLSTPNEPACFDPSSIAIAASDDVTSICTSLHAAA